MGYLVLSIFCSTLIVIIFKLFDRYRIDNLQAIVYNYIVCTVIGFALTQPDDSIKQAFVAPWFPFAILLGFLFIFCFWLMAKTVEKNGITVASVASKLSLIIPTTAAFFLYGDTVFILKILVP